MFCPCKPFTRHASFAKNARTVRTTLLKGCVNACLQQCVRSVPCTHTHAAEPQTRAPTHRVASRAIPQRPKHSLQTSEHGHRCMAASSALTLLGVLLHACAVRPHHRHELSQREPATCARHEWCQPWLCALLHTAHAAAPPARLTLEPPCVPSAPLLPGTCSGRPSYTTRTRTSFACSGAAGAVGAAGPLGAAPHSSSAMLEANAGQVVAGAPSAVCGGTGERVHTVTLSRQQRATCARQPS